MGIEAILRESSFFPSAKATVIPNSKVRERAWGQPCQSKEFRSCGLRSCGPCAIGYLLPTPRTESSARALKLAFGAPCNLPGLPSPLVQYSLLYLHWLLGSPHSGSEWPLPCLATLPLAGVAFLPQTALPQGPVAVPPLCPACPQHAPSQHLRVLLCVA